MDPIAKRILEAFDELSSDALDLNTLAERGRSAPEADRDAVRATLMQLVQQGLLRPAGRFGHFARTEEGRLAIAGPLDVTLYTRRGCHLCEEAKAQMAPVLRKFGAKLYEVDVDQDAALRERYTNDVPVVFLGSRKVAKHRIDLAQLRRQLERALR